MKADEPPKDHIMSTGKQIVELMLIEKKMTGPDMITTLAYASGIVMGLWLDKSPRIIKTYTTMMSDTCDWYHAHRDEILLNKPAGHG